MIFKNRKNKKRILNEIKASIDLINFNNIEVDTQTKEKNEAKVFEKGKVYGDSKMFNNNVTFCYKSIYGRSKVSGCSKLYGHSKRDISQDIPQQEKK